MHVFFKRIGTTLLLAAVLMAAMAFLPVSADDIEYHDVYYGTPTIDGVIDDMYRYSYHAEIEYVNNQGWGKGAPNSVFEADVYVLWDENYLYFAALVHDDTLTVFTEDEAYDEKEGYAQRADMFICCFNYLAPSPVYFKIGMDAFGTFLSAQESAYTYIDVSKAKYAADCTPSQGEYVVEMALPFQEPLHENFEIGWHFMIANAARDNANGYNSSGPGNNGCWGNNLVLKKTDAASLVPEEVIPEAEPFVISDVVLAILGGVAACGICGILVLVCRKKRRAKS